MRPGGINGAGRDRVSARLLSPHFYLDAMRRHGVSPKLYRKRADRLKFETFKLAGFVSVNLPDSVSSDPEFARLGELADDSPVLQAIARQIDEVLCAFDELQECLGVPPETVGSRFAASPADRTTMTAGEAGDLG
jgi:hypothetical protein